jgi:hypothetical protein
LKRSSTTVSRPSSSFPGFLFPLRELSAVGRAVLGIAALCKSGRCTSHAVAQPPSTGSPGWASGLGKQNKGSLLPAAVSQVQLGWPVAAVWWPHHHNPCDAPSVLQVAGRSGGRSPHGSSLRDQPESSSRQLASGTLTRRVSLPSMFQMVRQDLPGPPRLALACLALTGQGGGGRKAGSA